MTRLTALALLLLLSKASFSQTDSTAVPDTLLDEVRIQAFQLNRQWKDAPFTVHTINPRQLQAVSTTSFLPAFNSQPGVRIEERSPGSYRFSMRGSLIRSPFGVRNIKFYLSGLPFTDATGNTYFNTLDPEVIERAEIIKGPTSSIYGANTAGTVLINPLVFSKSNRQTFKAELSGGSYGTFRGMASYNRSDSNSSMRMLFSHQQSEGYRVQSEMKRSTLFLDQSLRVGKKGALNFVVLASDLQYETPGGLNEAQFLANPKAARPATPTLPSAEAQKAGIFNKTIFGGVSYDWMLSGRWSSRTGINFSHTDFRNPFITNYEVRDELNYGLRQTFTYNNENKNFQWLTGIEWQRNNAEINNFQNNGGAQGSIMYADDVNTAQTLVFSQVQLQATEKLLVQAGLSFTRQRFEWTRMEGGTDFGGQWINQVAPAINAIYSINRNISVYALTGLGFSPPTLAEIRPSTAQFYILAPESGWNYEAGIKGGAGRISYSVGAYQFNLKNALVRRTDSTGSEYFVNAGKAIIRGIEVFSEALLFVNDNKAIRRMNLSVSYSYQPYKFGSYTVGNSDYNGKNLTGTPEHILSSTVSLSFAKGIFLNAQYLYNGELPLDDANSAYAKGYHLVQARVGVRMGKFEFFVAADNLLDETYSLGNDLNALGKRYYNAAARRGYMGGVRFSSGGF